MHVLTVVYDIDGAGGADPSISTKVEAPAPPKLVDQMPVIPDYLKPKPQKTVRYFLKYIHNDVLLILKINSNQHHRKRLYTIMYC